MDSCNLLELEFSASSHYVNDRGDICLREAAILNVREMLTF